MNILSKIDYPGETVCLKQGQIVDKSGNQVQWIQRIEGIEGGRKGWHGI